MPKSFDWICTQISHFYLISIRFLVHLIEHDQRTVTIEDLIHHSFKYTDDFYAKEEYDELEKLDNKRNKATRNFLMSHGSRYKRLNVNEESLPYDYNRIVLKKKINDVDYINATWMKEVGNEGVYDELIYNNYLPFLKVNFILAQVPIPETYHHYIEMLYEKKVNLVVHIESEMNIQHDQLSGLNLSDPPEWLRSSFDDLSCQLLENFNLDENLSKQNIMIKKFDKTRQIKHFCFVAWPSNDDFREDNAKDWLRAINLIRKEMKNSFTNFTVVCQDQLGGISGASSFLALYPLLQSLDEEIQEMNSLSEESINPEMHAVNLFQVVKNMRQKRAHVVQTFNEYRFLYRCLAFYSRNKQDLDKIFKNKEPRAGTPRTPKTPKQILTSKTLPTLKEIDTRMNIDDTDYVSPDILDLYPSKHDPPFTHNEETNRTKETNYFFPQNMDDTSIYFTDERKLEMEKHNSLFSEVSNLEFSTNTDAKEQSSNDSSSGAEYIPLDIQVPN